MRKLLFVGVVAATALCLMPERSQAQGPGFGPGGPPYGFLGRLATRHMMWIHSDGPLFNYGPYHLPGHVHMHIPKPYYGTYTPGDYTLWNSGGYGGGYGYQPQGYPAYGAGYPAPMVAPQTAPPVAPPVPVAPVAPVPPPPKKPAPVTFAEPANDVIPAAVTPTTRVRLLPTPYNPIYPSWLTGR